MKLLLNCKYCGLDFSNKTPSQKGGHTRFCKSNPDIEKNKNEHRQRNKNKTPWNKGLISPYSDETNQKKAVEIKKAHEEGKYEGSAKKSAKTRIKNNNHLHTEKAKEKIRKAALTSPHRRLRKGVVEYKGIILDSSWELALAKRLDELNIKWVRPDPIPWVDEEGITHNYFADFYLPDYDKYIDPKNKHAIKVQEKKIRMLLEQYENIVILDSLEKCETFSI